MTVTPIVNMKIRDVHEADRPRERLIRQGAKSLSNQELIAILLGTGTKNESVLAVANRVLLNFEKLHNLKHATLEEMKDIKGIGEAKAVLLLAAIELGRRLASKDLEERYTIRSPEDAAMYLMQDMTSLQQEHFVCTDFTQIQTNLDVLIQLYVRYFDTLIAESFTLRSLYYINLYTLDKHLNKRTFFFIV